ncbi:hypothetical protein JTB14_001227 [Gonioctena quinquepunctata]|nr:hypothetical protein JTB14_001227 [Gonioctena quinquepunctata]
MCDEAAIQQQRRCTCCCEKVSKYCVCGRQNPCSCNISQIRALCSSICVRCGSKVYAAEKISVSSGAYHTSCFSCFCCHKLLDVKNVYENSGEIYCRSEYSVRRVIYADT